MGNFPYTAVRPTDENDFRYLMRSDDYFIRKETVHGMVGHCHNNEARLIFCDKKTVVLDTANSDFVLLFPKLITISIVSIIC